MSGIKAGLAVIEGSTAGVSAGMSAKLQVGDVVQSVYDYVDIAWRTLLTGCIAILAIQYLLEAVAVVDGYIFATTCLVFGLVLGLRWWARSWTRTRRIVKDMFSFFLIFLIAAYYILPVSVWSASRLSDIITRPSVEEAQKGFSQTRAILFQDDTVQSEGFIANMRNIPERIGQIATYIKTRSSQMAVWTVKLITGYIFDCIVFPLLIFTLLLWLTRGALRYVLQKNFQTSLHDELKTLLVRPRLRNGVKPAKKPANLQ